MTDDLRATARRWRAAGRAAVVVEVLAAKGSVPRDAGTRMLVAADAVAGTIGGGQLELQATAEARQMLAAGDSAAPRRRHVALGPSLGQCCGGAVDIGFTPLARVDPDDTAAWPADPPLFSLQLYGAGHVGRAIVPLLATLPCRVWWIDERESEFPPGPPLPEHIRRVCVEPVEAEVGAAPPGCFYLVLTHSHALDLAISAAVVQRMQQRGDVGWFGLIGSKTKRARFEHRLLERGADARHLERMVCPIGVAGIRGKQPEVIALAVVAQLLQNATGGF